MEWVAENWKTILDAVAYIIAGASVIVKLTPTPTDDGILEKVIRVLAVLGLNKKV